MSGISQSTSELNLSVLRRYNSSIASIVTTASYAVVYSWDTTQRTWHKTGIEGSLFICALADEESVGVEDASRRQTPAPTVEDTPTPQSRRNRKKKGILQSQGQAQTTKKAQEVKPGERFQLIILNRRGLENFMYQLISPQNIELTEKFIILPHEDGTVEKTSEAKDDDEQVITGLWIWEDPPPASTAGDRERIGNLIKELATRAYNARLAARAREVNQGRSSAGMVTPILLQQMPQEINPIVEEAAESVPMATRSISLAQLFEQARLEDAGFGLHNHNDGEQPAQVPETIPEHMSLPIRSIPQPQHVSTPQQILSHQMPPQQIPSPHVAPQQMPIQQMPPQQMPYGQQIPFPPFNALPPHSMPGEGTNSAPYHGQPLPLQNLGIVPQQIPGGLPFLQQLPGQGYTPDPTAFYPSHQGPPPPPHLVPPTPTQSQFAGQQQLPLLQSLQQHRPPPPPHFASPPNTGNPLLNILTGTSTYQH